MTMTDIEKRTSPSDIAQVRMDDLAADLYAERIAAALRAAGFDPPPYVGQGWVDPSVTWLPEGHRSIATITSLGNTVSGWQARVVRRQVDADGIVWPSGDGSGVVYVDHLVEYYEAVDTR